MQCDKASASGNDLMKENSNIELPRSCFSVSGTMTTALTHCPSESAEQPYEVDIMIISILPMKTLKPGMAE